MVRGLTLDLPSLLPHGNDHPIGPDIFINDLSTGEIDNPVHFLRHLFLAKKSEPLAAIHIAETCPHVFITPSAILAVVYVYFYTFSHFIFLFVISSGWTTSRYIKFQPRTNSLVSTIGASPTGWAGFLTT